VHRISLSLVEWSCVVLLVRVGVEVNTKNHAVTRRKAQFFLMEFVPQTLQGALAAFPDLVPYSWALAVLTGVCHF
jgi:hypothetical protein